MRGYSRDTLIFILMAALMMWVADYYLFGGKEAIQAIKSPPAAVPIQPEPAVPAPIPPVEQSRLPLEAADDMDMGYDDFDFFNDDEWEWYDEEGGHAPLGEAPALAPSIKPAAITPPASAPPPPAGGKPKVAIIIDDVGMNLKYSREAVNLPAHVTMAILPYSDQAAEFAKLSREKGHEIIIHTPMEAMHAPVSLGGMGLTTQMDGAAIEAMMETITHRFDGFIGINNHMGSKFTADRAAMERLMPYLKKHNLIFVDSRTIGTSVASVVAAEQGVPNASRDVFLDHEGTPEFVAAALAQLERLARRNGSAIAIGHPKAVTMQGLQFWLPTLEEKGIELVPVSQLVRHAPIIDPPNNIKEELVTVSAPAAPSTDPAPPVPPSEPLLLYSPSPEIRY